MISSLAAAPRAAKAQDTRTGLFARLTLGAEYASVITERPEGSLAGSFEMSGTGIAVSGDVGYAPNGSLAGHLRVQAVSVSSPTFTTAGESYEPEDVHLTGVAFGLGGTYYPVRFFYVTGVFGAAQWLIDITQTDLIVRSSTDFGVWLNGDIGVELPFKGGVHIGLGVRASYGSMSGDDLDVHSTAIGGFASGTFLEP